MTEEKTEVEDAETRDLIAYVREGWHPKVEPAPRTREWMDNTRGQYAYRCLPLAMANAHGWQFLNRTSCEIVWDGGDANEAIKIRSLDGSAPNMLPVSIFGYGIVTFHVECVLRTPPGWNIWIGGPPNSFKDGIVPLNGMVETDWSPMSFTMNWKMTRPGHAVKFAADDPFCFFFPIRRGDVESFKPRRVAYESHPDDFRSYTDWSKSRDKFIKTRSERSASEWQKHYFQGTDIDGNKGAPDHQTKLKLRPFE